MVILFNTYSNGFSYFRITITYFIIHYYKYQKFLDLFIILLSPDIHYIKKNEKYCKEYFIKKKKNVFLYLNKKYIISMEIWKKCNTTRKK